MHKGFFKAGHLPTLFASFLYFDMSFMVWVLLGPLGVAVAKTLHLDPAHKGLMVATPVLAGAALRVVLGLLIDRFKAKRVGIGAQIVVIAGLIAAWMIGIDSFAATLLLGCVLGLAAPVTRARSSRHCSRLGWRSRLAGRTSSAWRRSRWSWP